jgi:hypothetical protein
MGLDSGQSGLKGRDEFFFDRCDFAFVCDYFVGPFSSCFYVFDEF